MNGREKKTDPFGLPRRAILVMNIILGSAGAAAVAALILNYGFREPPVRLDYLHGAIGVIVAIFVIDRMVRLVLARRKTVYFRENWIDFALIGVAGLGAAIGYRFVGKILSAGALYVIITQVYLLVALVLRAVAINLRFTGSGIHASWLLIGSFAFLALGGSGLLMLPVATPPDAPVMYYPDALFTATSATCVTGLIVKKTGNDFTLFGQAVILVLIQLGGLGIMLFGAVLAMLLGKELTVRGSETMGQMMGTPSLGPLPRLLTFVVLVTLLMEVAGAALLYPMFAASPGADGGPLSAGRAVWYSVFHSISSFCNAGFCLYDANMMEGVRAGWATPLRNHSQIFGVMAVLIVLGGLGFPVLRDCVQYVRTLIARALYRVPGPEGLAASPRPQGPRLSLHARIVLTTTALLLVFGALGLLLVEPGSAPKADVIGRHPIGGQTGETHADWKKMPPARRVREAVFQSITARTAGFNTIDMRELSSAGKLWLCGLMVVGGSPGGTAGGMKTVTLALLIAAAWSVLRRRSEVEAFRRSIPADLLRRVTTVAFLYLALVGVVTLLLSISMRDEKLVDVLFEACSACGTVGLTTGITGTGQAEMTKFVTMAGMFIGRLGPITLLLALTSGIRRAEYTYPRENILIG